MTDLVTMIREYAEDHYYCESWDVVADRWSDAEIATAIEGASTRRGAIAKAWGRLQVIDSARLQGDRPVKPISLLEFLAANGGIRNDDKLITEVRESIGGNLLVPRFGPLVREPKQISMAARKGGTRAPMFLDTAREAAAEAGYLDDSNINDLLAAIDAEARGNKLYPFGAVPFEPIEHREEMDNEIPF